MVENAEGSGSKTSRGDDVSDLLKRLHMQDDEVEEFAGRVK
jgi:hypothetical protein